MGCAQSGGGSRASAGRTDPAAGSGEHCSKAAEFIEQAGGGQTRLDGAERTKEIVQGGSVPLLANRRR